MNRKDELNILIANAEKDYNKIAEDRKQFFAYANTSIAAYMFSRWLDNMDIALEDIYVRFNEHSTEIGLNSSTFQNACTVYHERTGGLGERDFELNHSSGSANSIEDPTLNKIIILGVIAKEYKHQNEESYKLIDTLKDLIANLKAIEKRMDDTNLSTFKNELAKIENDELEAKIMDDGGVTGRFPIRDYVRGGNRYGHWIKSIEITKTGAKTMTLKYVDRDGVPMTTKRYPKYEAMSIMKNFLRNHESYIENFNKLVEMGKADRKSEEFLGGMRRTSTYINDAVRKELGIKSLV